MNNNHRELTGREKQQVRKLVNSHCANYDREYGCLPLDCDCPMLHICYTNSALCKRFRKMHCCPQYRNWKPCSTVQQP